MVRNLYHILTINHPQLPPLFSARLVFFFGIELKPGTIPNNAGKVEICGYNIIGTLKKTIGANLRHARIEI